MFIFGFVLKVVAPNLYRLLSSFPLHFSLLRKRFVVLGAHGPEVLASAKPILYWPLFLAPVAPRLGA